MDSVVMIPVPAVSIEHEAATVQSVGELARLLRLLRRREARNRDGATLTYRGIAARTGWSHAIIGEYLAGTALPPTDRFDQLIQILGATPSELAPLATARDRVEELRRQVRETSTGSVGERVPRELPAPVPGFVGRLGQLIELDRLAATPLGESDGLPFALVCGVSGVGKTALAVHWAHQHAERFPGGQLYIDLRGDGSQGEPVDPGDALGRFLQALGLEPARVPSGIDARASLYRTLVAGRRVLVMLDNACSSEQVRPLLPGSSSCMVVVTSRDTLPGLVVAHGARRVKLDVLSVEEGVRLLRTLLPGRIRASATELRALVEVCDRLPLALRAVAERAASHPEISLRELLADLRGGRSRRQHEAAQRRVGSCAVCSNQAAG